MGENYSRGERKGKGRELDHGAVFIEEMEMGCFLGRWND